MEVPCFYSYGYRGILSFREALLPEEIWFSLEQCEKQIPRVTRNESKREFFVS